MQTRSINSYPPIIAYIDPTSKFSSLANAKRKALPVLSEKSLSQINRYYKFPHFLSQRVKMERLRLFARPSDCSVRSVRFIYLNYYC